MLLANTARKYREIIEKGEEVTPVCLADCGNVVGIIVLGRKARLV